MPALTQQRSEDEVQNRDASHLCPALRQEGLTLLGVQGEGLTLLGGRGRG